jgi:hypothetical protein
MSQERERRVGGATRVEDTAGLASANPGKRTLTEGLGGDVAGASHGLAKARPKVPGDVSRVAGVDAAGAGSQPSSQPASQPSSQPALQPSVRADTQPATAERMDSPAPAPGVTPKSPPAPPTGPKWVKGSHITPTFSVTEVVAARSNTAASITTTDTPMFTGHVALDSGNWRYQLDTVAGTGNISIVYYTADHYPAPTPTDDSGALTNVTAANWSAMVADLRAHRTGMGGKWSAYRAEILHEHYHWEVEWQGQIKKALTKLETDIESISVSTTTAPTAADAEKALKPLVAAAFASAMAAARTAYNALGDRPGDPPYVAQAPAIDALVARVEAHAKAQGWP